MAKQTDSRGIRDEMNVGPDPRQTRHLRPLRELGKLQVADGEPDVRGWNVFTSTGREIGEVHELLVDTDSREVVMLDVDLKRNDRHTLAPVRAAWIDHAARRVIIDATEVTGMDELPSLARGARTSSDEEVAQFDERYGRAYGAYGAYGAHGSQGDDREYRVRHGDEELRFNRRMADLGDRGDQDESPSAEADVPRRSRWVERYPLEEPERYSGGESDEGRVHYLRRRDDTGDQEVVLERRPYVEEVVMRRRATDRVEGGAGGSTGSGSSDAEADQSRRQ